MIFQDFLLFLYNHPVRTADYNTLESEMTKELKLKILKGLSFYVIVACRLKFCVQRGFKDIQQEVERRENYYLSKNAFYNCQKK